VREADAFRAYATAGLLQRRRAGNDLGLITLECSRFQKGDQQGPGQGFLVAPPI
jgi:hypothetical protein